MFLPHYVSNPRRRGNDGGGGVVAKPDRLVAFQTLSSERVQHVHLSLSHIRKSITLTAEDATQKLYSASRNN